MTLLKDKRSYVGNITSAKMNKTVVVTVTETMRHKKYEKVIRRNTKFYAHDENNECNIGDEVEIIESRPISKLKRWRIKEIKERAK